MLNRTKLAMTVVTLCTAVAGWAQTTLEPLPAPPTIESLDPVERTAQSPPPSSSIASSITSMRLTPQARPTLNPTPTQPVKGPVTAYAMPLVSPSTTAATNKNVAPLTSVPQMRPADAVTPVTLPANTKVMLRINRGLSSADVRTGDRVTLSVARDVLFAGRVVIPRGTPAYGDVSDRSGAGVLGKSGNIEVAVRQISLAGQSIPISGVFKQRGQSRVAKTILFAILVGANAASLNRGDDAVFDSETYFEAATKEPVILR